MPNKSSSRKVSRLDRLLSYQGRSLHIAKSGWLFIVLSLAVGFAAINSGSNLLHIIFGCQMAFILASGLLSEMMLQSASLHFKIRSTPHAQTPTSFDIFLTNKKSKRPMLSLTVENDPSLSIAATISPVFSLVVMPQQTKHLHSQIVMRARGYHPFPPLVVSTSFPFGFFIKRKKVTENNQILVFPRIHDVHSVERVSSSHAQGQSTSKTARDGDFLGLSEYRPGMEGRRIYWPASARLGKMVVQDFETKSQEIHFLTIEKGLNGSLEFERAIEDTASQACDLLRQGGVSVGLHDTGQEVIPPGTGAEQERRILTYLALLGDQA